MGCWVSEPRLATCKVNALPTVLWFWSLILALYILHSNGLLLPDLFHLAQSPGDTSTYIYLVLRSTRSSFLTADSRVVFH